MGINIIQSIYLDITAEATLEINYTDLIHEQYPENYLIGKICNRCLKWSIQPVHAAILKLQSAMTWAGFVAASF